MGHFPCFFFKRDKSIPIKPQLLLYKKSNIKECVIHIKIWVWRTMAELGAAISNATSTSSASTR